MAIYDQVMISAPYGAVFSDGPPTFEYFKRIVRSLSRTDTLFWCARLNLILADPNLDHRAKQQQFLDMFFTAQQIDSLNKFAEERGGSQRVGVVHRGTLLELIRWACLLCPEHPDDGETFNKPETLDAFVRALLMANDFWAERVYRATFFEGASIDEKRRNALRSIRYAMGETRCDPRQFEALSRGVELFQRLLPEYYANFAEEFFKSTGMRLDEYYLCLCMLMVHYLNSEIKSGIGGREQPGIFTLKGIRDAAPHMESLFARFLYLRSDTPEEFAAAFWSKGQEEPDEFECEPPLKPLRERPVLRATDGRMVVLDPVCFAEAASVGPLFLVLSETNQKNLFPAFGYAFEAYVGSIFRRMYPDPGSHLTKRLYYDVRDAKNAGIQIADFIIDDVSDIVVIEAKAVWMQDAKMWQDDPDVLVAHLRAKYGGEEKEKGYAQLARNIGKISSLEWQPAGVDLTKTKRIFPVLLVHDEMLDAPVFGYFLAEEFSHALRPDSDAGSWMTKGDFRVAPLIVMTIGDLECLESSLNKFTMIALLKAYSSATPDRLVSLNNFLAGNSDEFPLIHNKSLASRCEEILQDCMRRVFPNKTHETVPVRE